MKKFTLLIGNNEIEIEGQTKDEAIKKVGLNPKHWQDNKGEKMKSKEVTNFNKIKAPRVNTIKKKPGRPIKAEIKPTNYRRKPNITTEDIGKWYTDGTDVWKLEDFIPEPQVSMSKVASADEIKKGYLSDFKDFRRLVPEPEHRRRLRKQG